jgi:hypothetical protein
LPALLPSIACAAYAFTEARSGGYHWHQTFCGQSPG